MNDRDRLMELIVNADTYDSYECKLCTKNDVSCRRCGAEKFADYLLANGATVQECGSWIDSCEYACLHKCSACGGNAPEDLESGLDTKTNYCPHCGAKMMPQPPKGE